MLPLTIIHATKKPLRFFANTSATLFARTPGSFAKPPARVHTTLPLAYLATRQQKVVMSNWAKGFARRTKDIESGKTQITFRDITKEEGKHLDRALRVIENRERLGHKF